MKKRLLLAAFVVAAFIWAGASSPIQLDTTKDEEEECWHVATSQCSAAAYFECLRAKGLE